MFTTSCSHTLHYITHQPTLSHCTTSHYSLHSHCTTSHYSLHSHTALHHTTAYTLTLHYITLQPTLSHCTTSHYSLHSHTVNTVLSVFSSSIATSPRSPPVQSARLRCSCPDLHTTSPQCGLRSWGTLSCGTSQK